MKFSYTIDTELGLLTVHQNGGRWREEIADYLRAVTSHPEFGSLSRMLVIQTRSDPSGTPDDIPAVHAHLEPFREAFAGWRWAVVAEATVQYAMNRISQVYLEEFPIEFAVFRTLHEARAWLFEGAHKADRET